MARAFKREAAKRDLVYQWIWYAENANIKTADRFLAGVQRTLRLLEKQPDSGSKVPLVRAEIEGIRRFPALDGFDKVLLFYIPTPRGIELVRVLHGSRDLEAAL